MKFILLTTSIAAFLTPFTSTVITFAVPGIGNEFHASFYMVALIPVSFLISLTSLMITLGIISDRYGRSLFFKIGLIIFILSSILAYFSQNIYELLSSIFLAGVGSALTGTNSTAIVTHVYPRGRRGGALGINAMSVYLGLTLAPFIGGILIQLYGWRSIFLFNIPLAILDLLLSTITLSGLNLRSFEKPDLSGLTLFSITFLSITIYISTLEIFDFIQTLPLLIIGLALFVIFIFHEKRNKPIIDPEMFRRSRTFTFSNISAFLNYLSTFSIVFIFSLYLQVVLHVSPMDSGLILTSEPIMMVVVSPISGRLSDIYGSREIAAMGTCMIGTGFLILYLLNLKNILSIVVSLIIIGIGFGFFTAPNTNSVMSSVKNKDLALASGILGTMRFTGQIFSILLSSFLISKALPRNELFLMFTGYTGSFGYISQADFVMGIKSVVLVSSVLSFLASITSLMKNRGE